MLKNSVKQNISSVVLFVFCIISLTFSSGCSVMMASATSNMMEHLSKTILNNDDLTLVESGAPAYLLMIDSLISKDPDNQKTLFAAATLYTAYADVFVKDVDRSKKMAGKALNYANQGICLANKNACDLKSKPFEECKRIISTMQKKHLPALFALGNSWASWIMVNKNDFNAIADLSQIELIMQRVTELDETYKDGSAYLYLGTMATLLPPALGGKPELGKTYFEKAIRLSQEKNLMVKVLFAKLYARMIFDRELHDKLLDEVISANPYVDGYTLVNTWAQQQAVELKISAEDYF